MLAAAVAIKWVVIGRYRAGEYPLWGSYFFRWWFVNTIQGAIPGYKFTLDLTATKPPALHQGGFIDYGAAGSTYYYSRTRMDVTGSLTLDGLPKAVTGPCFTSNSTECRRP